MCCSPKRFVLDLLRSVLMRTQYFIRSYICSAQCNHVFAFYFHYIFHINIHSVTTFSLHLFLLITVSLPVCLWSRTQLCLWFLFFRFHIFTTRMLCYNCCVRAFVAFAKCSLKCTFPPSLSLFLSRLLALHQCRKICAQWY